MFWELKSNSHPWRTGGSNSTEHLCLDVPSRQHQCHRRSLQPSVLSNQNPNQHLCSEEGKHLLHLYYSKQTLMTDEKRRNRLDYISCNISAQHPQANTIHRFGAVWQYVTFEWDEIALIHTYTNTCWNRGQRNPKWNPWEDHQEARRDIRLQDEVQNAPLQLKVEDQLGVMAFERRVRREVGQCIENMQCASESLPTGTPSCLRILRCCLNVKIALGLTL